MITVNVGVALLIAALLWFWSVTPISGVAPALSNASVADGATGVALNAALTVDSDVALSATEVAGGWYSRTSGSTTALTNIHCADASTCWASDTSFTLRKTTNAGRTWTAQTTASPFTDTTSADYTDVFFVSTSTGYAVGPLGTVFFDPPAILRTTDGGTTWAATIEDAGAVTDDGVFYINSSTAVLVGSGGRIALTGQAPTTFLGSTSNTTNNLRDVYCTSTTFCVVVGDSGTIRTTTEEINPFAYLTLVWTSRTSGTTNNLLSVHCWSSTSCLAVGASGTILLTTNGGAAWSAQTSGTTATLRGVYCAGTAPECWAVGDSGTVLFTADADTGTVTWTAQTSGTSNQLNGIYGTSASRVWAVGNSGTIVQYGGVLLQANTGNTQGGAAAGANLCTSVALGADGSGNANRRVTCSHANLTANTWYTFTVTTAITDTGGDALAAAFTRAFRTAAAPVLSTASVTDGATARSTAIALTADFDSALSSGTVSTSTVTLQANTGNIQSGSPAGANLCTSVALGNDGSGNANRRVTCSHANLTADTWYTLTITGDANGIQSSAITTMSGNVTRAFKTDSAPSVSTASVTDSAVGQSTSVALTFDFGSALSAGTVSATTVMLQQHATNRQTGTASGSTKCSSAALAVDAEANADRRITCSHTTLLPGTWYTLTVAGGGSGIQTSSGVEMSSSVTRRFKTAYVSGATETVTAAELGNAATEGWWTVTQSGGVASRVTTVPELAVTATLSGIGTATATLPEGVALTRTGGGTFTVASIAMGDETANVSNATGTVRAAVQFGIPGSALTASSPVTIAIPVPATVVSGAVLDVYRDTDTNFSDVTTRLTTCTVAASACSFTTTALSYFIAAEPLGAPKSVDATPPAAPTNVRATNANGAVMLTWADPSDSDLQRIRILLMVGDRSILLGTVERGIQKFTERPDPSTAGQTYTFVLQAVDTTGNRSNSAEARVVFVGEVRTEPTSPAGTPVTPIVPATGTTAPAPGTTVLVVTATPVLPSVTPQETATAPVTTSPLPSATGPLPSATEGATALIPVTTAPVTIPVSSGTPGAPAVSEPTAASEAPTAETTTTVPTATGVGILAIPVSELPAIVAESVPTLARFPSRNVQPVLQTLASERPPCDIATSEHAHIVQSFMLLRNRVPKTPRDIDFLCRLSVDAEYAVDPTIGFPEYRDRRVEGFAVRSFLAFFRRLPSRDRAGKPLPAIEANRDWLAVKFMTYHLRVEPASRDLVAERRCTQLFTDRDIVLYKNGVRVRKPAGRPPRDVWDHDFLRACAYSSAPFLEAGEE